MNPKSKKNKLPKKPSRIKPKYTKMQLWEVAFEKAHSEFFYIVDTDGKPIKKKRKNFNYNLLTKEDKTLYNEFFHTNFELCEKLFYDEENKDESVKNGKK